MWLTRLRHHKKIMRPLLLFLDAKTGFFLLFKEQGSFKKRKQSSTIEHRGKTSRLIPLATHLCSSWTLPLIRLQREHHALHYSKYYSSIQHKPSGDKKINEIFISC
jgi:hypothetical protein